MSYDEKHFKGLKDMTEGHFTFKPSFLTCRLSISGRQLSVARVSTVNHWTSITAQRLRGVGLRLLLPFLLLVGSFVVVGVCFQMNGDTLCIGQMIGMNLVDVIRVIVMTFYHVNDY